MVLCTLLCEWLVAVFILKVFHAAFVDIIMLVDETRAKIFVTMDDNVDVVVASELD